LFLRKRFQSANCHDLHSSSPVVLFLGHYEALEVSRNLNDAEFAHWSRARTRSSDVWPASIATEGQEMQLSGLKVF
jgi:hypothetical protein